MSSSYRKGRDTLNGTIALAAAVRAAARTALVAGAALAAARASAANWDFNPRVEAGGTYNDNYRLAESGFPKTHVGGALVDAQFGIRSLEPTSELSILPRIHSTYFPTDSADQSTDGFLDLKGEYRTQKSDLAAVAQYANETVITSELLEATFPGVVLGQLVGGQSGRVTTQNRRQLERFAPTLTHDFTQRRHLHLDAEYLNASYNKNNVFEQIGFRNLSGSAGLGFDVTQRSTFTVRGVAARFEPNGSPNVTNRYGIETQWDMRRSQVEHIYLRLGVDRTEAQSSGPTFGTTGLVGGAGISWTYQITQFVLDGLRGLSPSASGAVVTQDEVRFRILRAFRPRLSGFVGVRGVSLRGADQKAIAIQGSDYVAVAAGMEFQITRSYRVSGTYDYTWQHFQGEPHAASNGVTLTIIYQPLSKYEPLPEFKGIPRERW
jgi:hypothetical protein